MKLLLVAGFLIGLPAVAVVLYFWGSTMMLPAIASLFVAALPFVGFAVVMRHSTEFGGEGDGH